MKTKAAVVYEAGKRIEIEELDQGDGVARVLVRQRAVMGPGPSGLTAAIDGRPELEERIVARRLAEHEQNMRATLEGIRALAEGGTG